MRKVLGNESLGTATGPYVTSLSLTNYRLEEGTDHWTESVRRLAHQELAMVTLFVSRCDIWMDKLPLEKPLSIKKRCGLEEVEAV